MALLSLHHGSSAVAELAFGSHGRRTTVSNARARIARAVQFVGQKRLAAFLAEFAGWACLVADAAAPPATGNTNPIEDFIDALCCPSPSPRRPTTPMGIGPSSGLLSPPPHGQGQLAPLSVL
eukprot:3998053-Lingulodinium_polyedra.AAC.1